MMGSDGWKEKTNGQNWTRHNGKKDWPVKKSDWFDRK